MGETTQKDFEQQERLARARLIDHFKRVYSIIAGLAITEACKRLWLAGGPESTPQLWMFLTFFITVVPIFHGGDRSLDQKYIIHPPKSPLDKFAYLWDVYMLLITALLFFFVAESMPEAVKGSTFRPNEFYFWMGWLFAFDVVVLAIDWCKNRDEAIKNAYEKWIILNFALAGICFVMAGAVKAASGTGYAIIHLAPGIDLTLAQAGAAVFVLASLRTVFDYIWGGKFMFP
jgi:hypothetical protein